MNFYQRFKKLNIDYAAISLEQRDTPADYFCTPKGAKVIGWAGVDGIHCCFVKGFGEMVFTVSPMNTRGNYVKPVANTFEDFLRLLLACGGLAAVEQAWIWNRGEFDAFLETYPPDDEQRAVLNALRDKLSITPMDDPYGYIKGVQSSFDYGRLSFSEKYYELASDEPGTQEPPERPKWKVYFENGFGSCHRGRDKPGIEITVNKIFAWGGRTWHIPSVYSCGKGLVVDFCVEIDPAAHWAFWEKWRPWWEGGKPLTSEEEERQIAENPMTVDFTPKATVNGRELHRRGGNGFGWIPMFLRQEYGQGEYSQQDWESIRLMEHYGLDAKMGWTFWRYSFPWESKRPRSIKSLSLTLEREMDNIFGAVFTPPVAGESITLTNPVTEQEHILTVRESDAHEMDQDYFYDDNMEYPTHCVGLTYTIFPDLQNFYLRDCDKGDSPRAKHPNPNGPVVAGAVGVIGMIKSDSEHTYLHPDGTPAKARAFCSSLHFEPVKELELNIVFREKRVPDIEVQLI